MSVKIKVSYTDEEEYQEIMQLLSPVVKSWKMQPAKGKYKRAYSEKSKPIKGKMIKRAFGNVCLFLCATLPYSYAHSEILDNLVYSAILATLKRGIRHFRQP